MEDVPELAPLVAPLFAHEEPAAQPALPQAQAPPIHQAVGGVPPPRPQPTNYREKYLDPTNDVFGGNYTNLYNEYSVGQSTPLELRSALYRDGNTGTHLHILLHVRANNAKADNPGVILGYHRLSRHDPRFGQLLTAYDNLGVAFFGDAIYDQAPLSVQLPEALFNQLGAVQVPTRARLAQLIIENPAANLFGPFTANDADVEALTTRQLVVVPNKYIVPFLNVGMPPKDAYLLLQGMIEQDGNAVACAPLLDWLRVTMTRRAANLPPRTCVEPITSPTFVMPQDLQAFSRYRLEIFHADLPHLRPGAQHNSALMIAQGISALTTEQRLTRQEAVQHRQEKEALKTPANYFGVTLDRLMRWCQVESEDDLPPIYTKIANTKKGRARIVLQTAVEDTLTNLRYLEDFPLSPTLANKILELSWNSQMKDDFTVGINIFSFGSLEEKAMQDQRRINQHANTIAAGDAAPSLQDISTIQDGKFDLYIPKIFAQLRYCIERSQALWQILLGSHHPVPQQYKQYRDTLITQEKRLERIVPRDPRNLYIVPALLARVAQLETNNWLYYQMRTTGPLPMTMLSDVFTEIERERHWEPTFPARYLLGDKHLKASQLPAEISLSSGTSLTDSSTLSRSVAPGIDPVPLARVEPEKPTQVRNTKYNEDAFSSFKALGIRSPKLRESLQARNIALPLNAKKQPVCLPYHVLGFCNSRCSKAADHAAHTPEEDLVLKTWCQAHYKLE